MKNALIIIGIIAIFLLGIFVGDNFSNNTNAVVKTDTIYQDTGTHTVEVIPEPYRVDSFHYDTIYQDSLIYAKIDTIAILDDYLLKRYYMQDTTIADVDIKVKEIVQFNKLVSRSYRITNTRVTTINKIYPPKFSLIGGGGFGSKNLHLGAGFEYKNSIIIYNHNFLNEHSKHTISYYHKFNFNRKKLTVF